MSSSGTTALRPACLLWSTGGWRGMVCIIDVEVVEPHVQKFGGEREVKKNDNQL